MNIKTILTVLFVLLLYPLKMPQGDIVPGLYGGSGTEKKSTKDTVYIEIDCSQVFRVVEVETLDSIWTQKYPYSSYETITCDSAVEFHWEYYKRYSYDSVLVRDTTVYVGE